MEDSELRQEIEARHPESFGWALCCCGRDADRAGDVLQRVYLKILDGKARFDGRGSFKTWLFAVIRRTALDERRRRWLEEIRLKLYGQRHVTPEPKDNLDRDALQQAFEAALADLAPRQRETLHLIFYQDLSLAEAAVVLGVSVGSVRQHYDRGKANLRQRLGHLKEFQERDSHEQSATRGSAIPGAVH